MSTHRVFRQDLPLRAIAAVGGTIAVPPIAFLYFREVPRADLTIGSPSSHFVIVSVIAALALTLAGAVIWAARKLPDSRTFFLAMGFLAMATIFLAHGLGTSPLFPTHAHGAPTGAFAAYGAGGGSPTEGVVAAATPFDPTFGFTAGGPGPAYGAAPIGYGRAGHESSGAGSESSAAEPAAVDPVTAAAIARGRVVGYSAQLSLIVSAIFFALATLQMPSRVQNLLVRHWGLATAVVATPLAGHVFIALAEPDILARVPIDSDPVKLSIAYIAIALLAFAGIRFYQSYRLAQLPLQAAMALGMVLLIEAQVFMLWGRLWQLSWWEYHLVMLGGFAVCVGALLRQYRMTGDLGAIVEGLFLRHQVNGLRAGDPRALRALSAAVAAKDSETAGHIDRVGDLTVSVAERLGLKEERLEVLRLAGRLHDVGKIGVPNNILRKPGRLTPEEFEVIKRHTTRGWQLAVRSEMLAHVAPIIRAHHEKLDGSGYPDGLQGREIPFEARIVAVADVWDALTCDRPYRKAMSWDEAAAILERDAGSHLDPRCVQALFEQLDIPYFRVPYLKASAA